LSHKRTSLLPAIDSRPVAKIAACRNSAKASESVVQIFLILRSAQPCASNIVLQRDRSKGVLRQPRIQLRYQTNAHIQFQPFNYPQCMCNTCHIRCIHEVACSRRQVPISMFSLVSRCFGGRIRETRLPLHRRPQILTLPSCLRPEKHRLVSRQQSCSALSNHFRHVVARNALSSTLTLRLAALQPDRRQDEGCARAAASCEWLGARVVRLEAGMTDNINAAGEPGGDLRSKFSALGQSSLST